MSPAAARRLNAVFVLAMCAMLLGAYGVQFILRELPCPLCLLQRAGMLGVAVGGLLNVKFGIRPSHYGIALISAMLDGQFDAEIVPPLGYPLHGLAQAAFTLAFVVAVANALTTFLMCGLGACPDNPTAYLRLR